MAKPKFTLVASPTFTAPVQIPVAGGGDVQINFTFKHRTADAFKKFIDAVKGREDIDLVLDVASGWDLDEPFDKANIDLLLENYLGSGRAVLDAYVVELTGARTKN